MPISLRNGLADGRVRVEIGGSGLEVPVAGADTSFHLRDVVAAYLADAVPLEPRCARFCFLFMMLGDGYGDQW